MSSSPAPAVATPPHDLEAETSVLGAILLDKIAISKIVDILTPEDFYRENAGQIYKAALSLFSEGEPLDHITLSAELEKRGILDRIGGRSHLATLQEQTPTAANIEHYARIVKGLATKRRVIGLGQKLVQLGHDELLDAREALETVGEPLRQLEAEALEAGDKRHAPMTIRISEVEREEVEWLWWQRLPLGKVVVLDGDPGLGKSTVTLDLAARVSTGSQMPDGTDSIPGGAGVVVLSAEDGLADTIRPRLEDAGADLERVATFKVSDAQGAERFPELPADIPAIERVIAEMKAKLLIIDPLMAYLGGEVNSHRDQDVRRALAPLANLAERAGVVAVVVRHLNKASGGSPIYRGGGSIGIIGAARVGLLVAKDPQDEERRILAPLKNNLSASPLSLAYKMVAGEKGTVRVEWQGSSDLTAAQLLVVASSETAGERSALEEAEAFLIERLSKGPVPSKEALEDAREFGIADRTLKRARQVLQVKANKRGMNEGWCWSLPGVDGSMAAVSINRDSEELPKLVEVQQ
ncbi:MAG: AAA family ATPase [Candidatus Dormibacteraceae bacterium]